MPCSTACTNLVLLDHVDELLGRRLGGYPSGPVNPAGSGSEKFLYPTAGSEAGGGGGGRVGGGYGVAKPDVEPGRCHP